MFHACLSFRYPVTSYKSMIRNSMSYGSWEVLLMIHFVPPPDSHHFEAPKSGLDLNPLLTKKGTIITKKWYQQLELPTLRKKWIIHNIYIYIHRHSYPKPLNHLKKNIMLLSKRFFLFIISDLRQAKTPPRQTGAWARCENSVGLLREM